MPCSGATFRPVLSLVAFSGVPQSWQWHAKVNPLQIKNPGFFWHPAELAPHGAKQGASALKLAPVQETKNPATY
jgi:hypothetical protein